MLHEHTDSPLHPCLATRECVQNIPLFRHSIPSEEETQQRHEQSIDKPEEKRHDNGRDEHYLNRGMYLSARRPHHPPELGNALPTKLCELQHETPFRKHSGQEGLEPSTFGFGDRRSAIRATDPQIPGKHQKTPCVTDMTTAYFIFASLCSTRLRSKGQYFLSSSFS